ATTRTHQAWTSSCCRSRGRGGRREQSYGAAWAWARSDGAAWAWARSDGAAWAWARSDGAAWAVGAAPPRSRVLAPLRTGLGRNRGDRDAEGWTPGCGRRLCGRRQG